MPTTSIAGASMGAECTVARGGIVRGSFALQADTHGEGTRALGGIGVCGRGVGGAMVDAPERTGIRLGISSGVPEVGARVPFGESVKPSEGHGPSPVTSEENSLPKPCSVAT